MTLEEAESVADAVAEARRVQSFIDEGNERIDKIKAELADIIEKHERFKKRKADADALILSVNLGAPEPKKSKPAKKSAS